MPQINWNLLSQFADPGQAVQQGFQQGYQFGGELKAKNALSAYIQNPDQPLPANALAGLDSRTALAIVGDQRERAAAAEKRALAEREAKNKYILTGAEIVRNIKPQDQAGWERVKQVAVNAGIPPDLIRPDYDPDNVQWLMDTANSLAPIKADKTSLQQNYEWLETKDPALAGQYLRGQAEGPPIAVDNGDGTKTLYPRSALTGASPTTLRPPQAGGPKPGAVVNGFRFKGGNPNDRGSWEPEGGQSGAPAGTFRP